MAALRSAAGEQAKTVKPGGSQAGRQRQRLLRSGQEHVDAEGVKLDFRRRQRTHAVHDEKDIGIFLLQRGDLGERTHDAGGSLVVDEGEGVELAGREFCVHGLGPDGQTPLNLERLGRLAAALGDVEPFVREGAAHAVEHFFGDEIADGPFHHAPRRAGAQINKLAGVEERLQLRLDFGVEVLEGLAAVSNHRRAKRLEGFLADFDRPRNVQLDVRHGSQAETLHGERDERKLSFPVVGVLLKWPSATAFNFGRMVRIS